MEEPREGDCRVPLISTLLCLLVAAGGVLLFIYVFKPSVSKPWYPVASFLFIGSPWIFWLLTYTYTCIKACVRTRRLYDHQISRRSSTTSSHARSSTGGGGGGSSHNNSNKNNNAATGSGTGAGARSVMNDHSTEDDGKRVHFGGVVVMDNKNNNNNAQGRYGVGGNHPPEGQNQSSSVTSSKEIEMPLNLSVSS